MRDNLDGTMKAPHPELVEGRTLPIPFIQLDPLLRKHITRKICG
jgi:hypothetical protein